MPKVMKSGGREMILRVEEFCEVEMKNKNVLMPLKNVRARIAAMTGMFWGCLDVVISLIEWNIGIAL